VGPDVRSDASAKQNSIETILALGGTLLDGGQRAIYLEGDATLLDTVCQTAPDICFNIAKGLVRVGL
jgi:hypothetical protein